MSLRVGTQTGGYASGLLVAGQTQFAVGSISVAIGIVSEADSALAAIAVRGTSLSIAVETDSAFSLTSAKSKSVGQPVEVDTSLVLTPSVGAALGIALEFDSALLAGRLKEAFAQESDEVDIAQPLTVGAPPRIIGIATEISLAQPLTRVKTAFLGPPVSETDTAQSIVLLRTVHLGLATEVDSALVASVITTLAKIIPIGLVLEDDAGLPFTRVKTRGIGMPPAEVDEAFLMSLIASGNAFINIELAEELDFAQSASFHKIAAIYQAEEIDLAQLLALIRTHSIGLTNETDIALAMLASKRRHYRKHPGIRRPPSTGFRRVM